MRIKTLVIATLSLTLISCTETMVPINFQEASVSGGTIKSLSCREINNSVDKALIETNTLLISLLRSRTISAPRIGSASAYFNSAAQSELTDFSRLKGELKVLSIASANKSCGRYVMLPEELIEYQLNQVRKSRGILGNSSYPVKIIKFTSPQGQNQDQDQDQDQD